MNIFWKGLGFVIIGSLLMCGCSVARPLRRPSASVRASVLHATPIGTPREAVEGLISKQRWRQLPDTSAQKPNQISVCFGGYFYFFGTKNVYGTWDFGDSNTLLTFDVYKEGDGL